MSIISFIEKSKEKKIGIYSDPEADPEPGPLFPEPETDPWIRIRIKNKRIRNTVWCTAIAWCNEVC